MRKFLHINLHDQSIREEELNGEEILDCGRHYIARTLLESGVARVDPLSPDNPLIFSAGPFAGTNFSNANRTSVGCKSPLTGGIKEANAGGNFGFALGQLHLAGFTLNSVSPEWVTIYLDKLGGIHFESAEPYLGLGNFEAAARLHEKYGKKVSIALCGPVGEYQGLVAGIAFSDVDQRPSRLAARGGVGAVMGNKKVKAIIVDLHKMPSFHERKKLMKSVREYGAKLNADQTIQNFANIGTAMVADFTNEVGGLPVRNFSSGRLVDTNVEPLKMGGDFLRKQAQERGGDHSHACMPGCLIKCSNVYADVDGNEVVSPIEYETLGLLGTNCGIAEPDDLARLNYIANDLGIDTIEVGASLAVLMEAGEMEFGDVEHMAVALDHDIRTATEFGKILAQGTAHVGEHYKVERVPVIKRQAISAYDPRVIEVTGLTMMMTAQGADHTAGNLPSYVCKGKDIEELVAASLEIQVLTATADSLGLCMFGRSVTNTNVDFMIGALNDAHGTAVQAEFFQRIGRETLQYETQFNKQAGFGIEDDELPAFFYHEQLEPSNNTARFHSGEVADSVREWWKKQPT
jgi:aldehyde:ferredoxin oxidoreductase